MPKSTKNPDRAKTTPIEVLTMREEIYGVVPSGTPVTMTAATNRAIARIQLRPRKVESAAEYPIVVARRAILGGDS